MKLLFLQVIVSATFTVRRCACLRDGMAYFVQKHLPVIFCKLTWRPHAIFMWYIHLLLYPVSTVFLHLPRLNLQVMHFPGPNFSVLHFPLLQFWSFIFQSCFFHPLTCHLCSHLPVLRFQLVFALFLLIFSLKLGWIQTLYVCAFTHITVDSASKRIIYQQLYDTAVDKLFSLHSLYAFNTAPQNNGLIVKDSNFYDTSLEMKKMHRDIF